MRVKREGSVHVLFYLEAFWSVLIINRKWWWSSSVPEAIEDDRGLKKVSREQGPEEGVRALNKATNHAGLDKSCHQWTSINHGGNYHSVWKWQPCIIMVRVYWGGQFTLNLGNVKQLLDLLIIGIFWWIQWILIGKTPRILWVSSITFWKFRQRGNNNANVKIEIPKKPNLAN